MPQRAKVSRFWRLRNGISSGRPRPADARRRRETRPSNRPARRPPSPGRRRCGPSASPPRPSAPARTPARAVAHQTRHPGRGARPRRSDGAPRPHRRPRERAAASRGTIDARRHRAAPSRPAARRAGARRDAPISSPSSMHRRRQSAIAEAIDGSSVSRAVRRGLAEVDAEARRAAARPAPRRPSTGRLRPGRACTTWRPARLAAEVVIEGDDAMDLGARQVKRLGDQRHGRIVDIAEGRLHAHAGSAGGRPADRDGPQSTAGARLPPQRAFLACNLSRRRGTARCRREEIAIPLID